MKRGTRDAGRGLQLLDLVAQDERLVVAIDSIRSELHRRRVDVIGEAEIDFADGVLVDRERLDVEIAGECEEPLKIGARKEDGIANVVRGRVPLADEHFAALFRGSRTNADDDFAGNEPFMRSVGSVIGGGDTVLRMELLSKRGHQRIAGAERGPLDYSGREW